MAVLTIAEFEKLKAAGWNSLDTTYDVSYKSHWKMWHAIREFYQNALDEHDEAGIKVLPTLSGTAQGLLIADQGRGLGAEALLLRETKRAAGDLRGQFGEGLKFACITALREGYGVKISSPLYSIRPILRDYQMVGKSFQIVSFLWKENRSSQVGTQIIIEGYKGETYRERFFPLARAAGYTRDVATVKFGRFDRTFSINSAPAPVNSLYVGDLYVRDLGEDSKASRYSYNLWNLNLNPDRDAETNNSRLHELVAYTWSLAPQDLIQKLLKQVEKNEGWEATVVWAYYPMLNASETIKAKWRSAWIAVYGEKGVLQTSGEWAKYAQAYGYTPIDMPRYFLGFLEDVVPTDEDTVKGLVVTKDLWRKPVRDSELSSNQRSLLDEARRLTKEVEKRAGVSPMLTVNAVRFSTNPETGTSVQGLWEEESKTVSLGLSTLGDARDMLRTLLHELGHWFGHNAPDMTAEHTEGVASVSVLAMEAERERVGERAPQREKAPVSAGPIRQAARELSWEELVAMANQAGIQGANRMTQKEMRRLLGLEGGS